jgi:hypothetical protein
MDYIIKDTTLRAIADSIRAKTGSADPIAVADMATQIEGITGGGGGSVEGYATVTFMNGGEVLFSRMVLKGDDCPDPWVQKRIDKPEKESTVDKVYTFNGWATAYGGSANANALKGITEDKTLYAAFAESVRMYTVNFYDGDTLLNTEQVAYGSMPSYAPTKEGASFGGWTPNTPVTGDTSYTAVWLSVVGSGPCGTSANWALDANGVLTVSGTGEVSARPYNNWNPAATNAGVPITSIVVEDGITTLPNSCFYNAKEAVSVSFPPSLVSIGTTAFEGCTKIKSLYIGDLAAWCSLTIAGSSALLGTYSGGYDIYLNGKKLVDLVIPNGVTTISPGLFYNCTSLASITFPENDFVTVGASAFQNCTGLTQINFTNGGAGLGKFAFAYCGGLTSVIIPNGVAFADEQVFAQCKGLTSATFQEGATSIAGRTFTGCTALSNVTLANSVTDIGAYSFVQCTLSSITIPQNVASIGAGAFNACNNLTSVTFEDTEGWDAGGTALASADLANPATAATYLKTTYAGKLWTKS